MHSTDESLVDRLDAIESECRALRVEHRRWRRRCFAALGCIAAILLAGARNAAREDVIKAGKFVLADANGGQRASLELDDRGAVALWLLGPDRKPRLLLGVDEEGGATIRIDRADGKPGLRMGIIEEGYAGLSLHDKLGAVRVGLLVRDGGCPEVAIMDRDGVERAGLQIKEDNNAQVYISDRDGKAWAGFGGDRSLGFAVLDADRRQRLALGWTPDDRGGVVGLEFKEPGGKDRVLLGVLADGGVQFAAVGDDRTPRFLLGQEPGESPVLRLWDESGKVLFRAPEP